MVQTIALLEYMNNKQYEYEYILWEYTIKNIKDTIEYIENNNMTVERKEEIKDKLIKLVTRLKNEENKELHISKLDRAEYISSIIEVYRRIIYTLYHLDLIEALERICVDIDDTIKCGELGKYNSCKREVKCDNCKSEVKRQCRYIASKKEAYSVFCSSILYE